MFDFSKNIELIHASYCSSIEDSSVFWVNNCWCDEISNELRAKLSHNRFTFNRYRLEFKNSGNIKSSYEGLVSYLSKNMQK